MKSIEHSLYHMVLRSAALTLALTLLFVSGTIIPHTASLTLEAERFVANSISASAGVEPTELNTITAALTEQQRELDIRETELQERELAVGLSAASSDRWWQGDMTTWINSVLLFLILVLMVLNYVLDFSFRRRVAAQ